MANVTRLDERDGLPRKLNAAGLLALVRELVADGARVTWRRHAFERMEERDITVDQVLQVLRRGDLVKGPEWSEDHRNWQFSMQANTAGELVTVAGALEFERLMGRVVVVITVF